MKKEKIKTPQEVVDITKTLKKGGFESYLVGGCVRDMLRGVEPKDWDIATNATPEQIIPLFEHTYYENDFGTVGIVNENTEKESVKVVEVTPYRTESGYSDKRRPDKVHFGKDIKEDLKRRDFTINAIAYDAEKHLFVDPHQGQDDLEKKILRAVGDPLERFEEDGLRILRAIRFQAEINFTIEEETLNAIYEKREILTYISKERIRDEFSRIINSKNPAAALELARRLDILKFIAPELEEGCGVKQSGAHRYDVFTHSLYSLQHAADNDWPFEVRLATLFHDVGKPRTRKINKQKKGFSFYGHEVVGAKLTEKALKRLKFPKETVREISTLVRWHMFFSDPDKISLSAIRRLLQNVGEDKIWDLMKIRFSDRKGMGVPKEQPYRLRKYQAMIEKVLSDPVSVKNLAIDGNDLIESINVKPGPSIGFILHALLEEVIQDPELNKRDHLLKRAKELSELDEEELKKLGQKGKTALEKVEKERENELLRRYNVK
ncbi:MAG: CCA tRNA nucleotidyltransferase [Candidatus Paceibacterota bacterium]